ncbi:hypothetical protein V7183_25195, partial [Bacillus sp. JJ1127]|uniref:hypothetical protein n=1 Tax=Bacillus sp. JJ1127 TaxID=3122952 RepID=UPI002FFDB2D7
FIYIDSCLKISIYDITAVKTVNVPIIIIKIEAVSSSNIKPVTVIPIGVEINNVEFKNPKKRLYL